MKEILNKSKQKSETVTVDMEEFEKKLNESILTTLEKLHTKLDLHFSSWKKFLHTLDGIKTENMKKVTNWSNGGKDNLENQKRKEIICVLQNNNYDTQLVDKKLKLKKNSWLTNDLQQIFSLIKIKSTVIEILKQYVQQQDISLDKVTDQVIKIIEKYKNLIKNTSPSVTELMQKNNSPIYTPKIEHGKTQTRNQDNNETAPLQTNTQSQNI